MRRCTKCGLEKTENYFPRSKARVTNKNPRGFSSHCKKCTNTEVSAWGKKHPAKTRIWAAQWDLKHWPMTRRELDRRRELVKKYGITFQEWDRIKQAQEGKCAICGRRPDKLVTDHCHTTKIVRGLLCDTCNRCLGLIKESKETLLKMVDYIKKFEI